MNSLLIPTTTEKRKQEAFLAIPNRSLLFNSDHKLLYVKYNDKLWNVSAAVDNDNIVYNEDNEIALAEHIHAETMTIKPTEDGPTYHDNIVFQHKCPERKIILVCRISSVPGSIAGLMHEAGVDNTSSLHFAVSNTISRTLAGAANDQRARWVQCRYIPTGEYYIGLMYYNGEEADIHFSGFDLRTSPNIPPEYVDADLDNLTIIVDDSDGKGQTLEWNNPNAIVWHFDEVPFGIVHDSTSDIAGIPKHSEVDFGNGLESDPDYRYTAEIHPKVIVNDDKGYFKQSRSGTFFDLYNKRPDALLEVMIDAGSNVRITRGSDGKAVERTEAILVDGVEYVRFGPLDIYEHYKINIGNADCKLYKMALIYDDIQLTQDGWPSYNFTWEFDSVPSWWEDGYYWNFHEGLTCIKHEVAYHNDTTNQTVTQQGSGEEGYLYPNSTGWANKGFVCVHMAENDERPMIGYKLKVEHDNTNINIQFITDVHGHFRELEILDENGNSVTGKIPSRYHYEHYSWDNTLSNMRMLTATLDEGTYYIVQHGPVRIYRIYVNRAARTLIRGGTNVSIGEAIDVIDKLPETGEDGDPHFVTLTDLALSKADLQKIAATLRDSDRQIVLDLSKCIVKEDAQDLTNIFWKCTSLKGIKLPQKVKTLGVKSFVGCIFLDHITLNDEVESIEGSSIDYAFAGTQLRVLILPKALKKLRWNCLANSGIRHVIIPPDNYNHLHSYLEYGSFFNMLDYVQIYMTQEEWDARLLVDGHDWNWWKYEHENYIGEGDGGCKKDDRVGAHITIYDSLDQLLKSLKYDKL